MRSSKNSGLCKWTCKNLLFDIYYYLKIVLTCALSLLNKEWELMAGKAPQWRFISRTHADLSAMLWISCIDSMIMILYIKIEATSDFSKIQ